MLGYQLRTIQLAAVAGLCAGAAACSADVAPEETVATTGEALTISPVASNTVQAAIYGYMYTWPNNGSTPVQLPVPNFPGSLCFLTNLWGSFQSSSDLVRVAITSDLKWILLGTSGGGTPSADAWCVTGSDFTAGQEVLWTGGAAISMPKPGGAPGTFADNNDTCFLTGLGGNVSNSGDNSARVRKVNGIWQVEGIAGVKVFARCVNHPAFAEQTITPPNTVSPPGLGGSNAKNFHPDHDYICGLTRVHGSLRGGWIGTYIQTGSDTGGPVYTWWTSGFTNPNNAYLGGTARCTM